MKRNKTKITIRQKEKRQQQQQTTTTTKEHILDIQRELEQLQ